MKRKALESCLCILFVCHKYLCYPYEYGTQNLVLAHFCAPEKGNLKYCGKRSQIILNEVGFTSLKLEILK